MLLLISGDIHPNPGPIDPCSVCSRRVTWGNRSIQCTGCSLWVHLSCSSLSLAHFRKISPGHSWTCPICPSSSQPPLPLTLQSRILILFCISILSHSKSPTFTHKQPPKPYLQKLNPPPKQLRIIPPIFLITPTNLYLPSLSIDYSFSSNPTNHLSSHTILISSFLSLSKQPPNSTVEC